MRSIGTAGIGASGKSPLKEQVLMKVPHDRDCSESRYGIRFAVSGSKLVRTSPSRADDNIFIREYCEKNAGARGGPRQGAARGEKLEFSENAASFTASGSRNAGPLVILRNARSNCFHFESLKDQN